MKPYIWKRGDKVVNVRLSGGSDDLVHGHLAAVVAVSDVFTDAVREQDWFL